MTNGCIGNSSSVNSQPQPPITTPTIIPNPALLDEGSLPAEKEKQLTFISVKISLPSIAIVASGIEMTDVSVVTASERTYYYENYYYLITNNIQQLFISRKG